MEKFGIFELLDALSAIVTDGAGENDAPSDSSDTDDRGTSTMPSTDAGASNGGGGQSPSGGPLAPNAGDAAFSPPHYDAEKEGTDALTSLLLRHEEIVRRIEKK